MKVWRLILAAVLGMIVARGQNATNTVTVTNSATVKLVWEDPNPAGVVTNFVVVAQFPDLTSRTWVGPRTGVTNSVTLAAGFGKKIVSGNYQFFITAVDTNNLQSDPAEWKGFLAVSPARVINIQLVVQ